MSCWVESSLSCDSQLRRDPRSALIPFGCDPRAISCRVYPLSGHFPLPREEHPGFRAALAPRKMRRKGTDHALGFVALDHLDPRNSASVGEIRSLFLKTRVHTLLSQVPFLVLAPYLCEFLLYFIRYPSRICLTLFGSRSFFAAIRSETLSFRSFPE